jgi:DNA-directed RNA polymerase sigma subunit (sigma70/sigma32)
MPPAAEHEALSPYPDNPGVGAAVRRVQFIGRRGMKQRCLWGQVDELNEERPHVMGSRHDMEPILRTLSTGNLAAMTADEGLALSPAEAAVLAWFVIDEPRMTYADAAKKLGVAEDFVRIIESRAKSKLRRFTGERWPLDQ